MSRFSHLASTALVAAALALAAPAPGFAQTDPVVTQDQLLTWTTAERFGVLVPVPEGAPVTDDVDTPLDRSFAVSTTEGSAPGLRVGIKVLTPGDLGELPAQPGEAGFDAFLASVGGVPVAPTGVVVQLGARALYAYGGSGTRTAPDGVSVQARMLFLVAHDLDSEGQGLMLAFYAQGMDPEAAAQAEAEFAARLTVAPGTSAPAVAGAAPMAETAPDAPTVADSASSVVLIDGLASLALTSGDVIVQTERGEGGLDLRLTNEQGQLLRVIVGPPDAALADRLRPFLGPRASVEQGEAGGQPVWRVQGDTNRPPIGRRTDGVFPITLVIPQYCLAAGEAFAVAVISEAGAGVDSLLQGLTFTRPDGADICATLAALPEALVAPPATIATDPTPAPVPPVATQPVPQPAPPEAAAHGKLPTPREGWVTLASPTPPRGGPTVVAPDVARNTAEIDAWAAAVYQGGPQGLWTYLKAYPNGQFAETARVMLQGALAMPAAPSAPAPAPAPATK